MLETERVPATGAWPWVLWLLGAVLGTVGYRLVEPYWLFGVVLGMATQLAGAGLALQHLPESTIGQTVLRRFPVGLIWVSLLVAALVGLSAWPLLQLREHGLPAVLGLSLALGLGWLSLWRIWPLLALAYIDRPRRRGPWQLLAHCWSESRRLVRADPSSARGLLAALVALSLLVGGLALGLIGHWPLPWRMTLIGAWWWLIAPFLSFVLVALVEPARLSASETPLPAPPGSQPARANPASKPREEPVTPTYLPVLLPGDPSARLMAAARLGRVDDALAALDAGADPKLLPAAEDRDQRSLVMLAAVLPDTRLLRRLIAGGAELNRRHAGLTPLLVTTRDSLRGRPDAVMTLLANGADPRASDNEGRTALHFAALISEPDVAALLIDAGAEVDALNRDGYSPLGVACASGNWRLARFLLERKAKPEPAGGQPALLAAAAGDDDIGGVQLLLKFKAKVDAQGRLGRTALLSAALAGNREIAELLLAAGADPDLADDHQVTPLLEAARAGANGVISALTKASPKVDVQDPHGRNALLLACQSPRANADTVASLLALGVDPAQPAGDGRHALQCAIDLGRWPLVKVLDPSCQLPSCLGTEADLEVLQQAVEHDVRPWPVRLDEALAEQDLWRVDAVLRASQIDPNELFDFVLRQGEQLGQQALDRLIGALPAEFLQAVPDPAMRTLRPLQAGLLHALARRGVSWGGFPLARVLQSLRKLDAEWQRWAIQRVEAGAEIFAPWQGSTALHQSLRLGSAALTERLLRCGVDPNAADANGDTALHLAARYGDAHGCALLLRYGAQIELSNAEGCSPYGLSLRHAQADVYDWLDWRGWQLPGRPLREADLVEAARLGDAHAVERLLMLGLSVDGRDAQGASALLRAAGGGHLDCVRCLIRQRADLQVTAPSGASPLTAAISMRHRAVVEVLLDAGVDLNQALPGGVTPLMVAAALGLPEMLVMLIDRGADARRTDENGNTALHALAQFGCAARDRTRLMACWNALLSCAAELADQPGGNGLSPLLLLLGARAEAGHPLDEECLGAQLEILLRHKPDLERRDQRGFAALHLCALHGLMQPLRQLLAAGADRQARDQLNRRAHEIAVLRGFVDIAAELDETTAPSMARLLRKTDS
ncbi:ankyrin repeat domain-containing protein [Pseudomarimonas arenosa]|uniref:Ankyrin repeat domain-containing protein n=1 Tax=Pseudomarimonas arenosa TaxID=2774145 RepID=A0AAW3ZIA3_9GAMM|nr:ankyrin repeat domain-containing protein [Pseudomarimonas arenosa]MBD8525813.1 ankyrin repeat domain-containing protein [Pseudomarimonas arenosa]